MSTHHTFKLTIFFILLATFGLYGQTVYQTISDGDWQSSSTWQNGNVPTLGNNNPVGSNVEIHINHNIDLTHSHLELDGDSTTLVQIVNGSLNTNSSPKKLTVKNGVFTATNSDLNVELLEVHDKFELYSSNIIVANGSFNLSPAYLSDTSRSTFNNSSIEIVNGNYRNNSASNTMITSCFKLNSGNYVINNGLANFSGVCINIDQGNFQIKGTSAVSGTIAALNVNSGNLTISNNSTWTAQVDDYHVGSSNNDIPAQHLGTSQSSAWMTSYFSTCSCLIAPASANTTTIAPGVWSDPAIWNNGVPGSTTNVTIAHDVTLNSNFTVGSTGFLNVSSGIQLTLGGTSILTIDGQLNSTGTIDGSVLLRTGQSLTTNIGNIADLELSMGANTLTLSSDAVFKTKLKLTDGTINTGGFDLILTADASATALIEHLSGTIVGDVTVQQYIQNGHGHHFLSSPVVAATLNELNDNVPVFTAGAAVPNVYYYDETNPSNDCEEGWTLPASTSETMVVGRGYTLYFQSNAGKLIDIKGDLNDGSISIPLTNTTSVSAPLDPSCDPEGWNFIGNPYASPIDLDLMSALLPSSVLQSYYRWDPTNKFYGSYVNGVASPSNFTNIVPAFQGFWVKTTANTSLVLDNSVRVTDPTISGPFFKTTFVDPLLRISINNSQYGNETVVRFNQQATNQFDLDFDAYYFKNENVDGIEFGTVVNGEYYHINSMLPFQSTPIDIQLYCKDKAGEQNTISLTEALNLNSGDLVYLLDNHLNTIHDLTGSDYVYTSLANDSEQRFVIRVVPAMAVSTDQLETNNSIKAYQQAQQLILEQNLVFETPIRIYNALGQELKTVAASNDNRQLINLENLKGLLLIHYKNGQAPIKFIVP